ncbi:MAG: hypothetical protein K5905_20880 [Roseibium sp.]|nr:hypothetical protein [Roseibium sp.]MCV0427920.1 hypothetical protein [Roseibium sp.]
MKIISVGVDQRVAATVTGKLRVVSVCIDSVVAITAVQNVCAKIPV